MQFIGLTIMWMLATLLIDIPQKSFRQFTPPGTVRINDTLFADITEVTLRTWSEYQAHIRLRYGSGSPEFLATRPDSTVWLWGGMTSNEPYQSQHLRSDLYGEYPVVGISYDQALSFCRWRTGFVKSQMDRSRKYPGFDIQYRLPSTEEWEYFAHSCTEVFNHRNTVLVKKTSPDQTVYQVKFAANVFINDSVEGFIYTQRTARYAANFFGLRDIIGNAAEMTSEEGISKGGSWKHTLEESRPGRDISYSLPQPWLGFRCVCVVRTTK